MDNLQELKEKLQSIVDQLQSKFPYAYIWCMQSKGLAIELTFKNESINSLPEKRGTVISVFNGRAVIEYVVDSLEIDDIKKAADDLIKNEASYPFDGIYNQDNANLIEDFFTKESIPLSSMDSSKKFELIKAEFENVRSHDLLNGRIFYRENPSYCLFVDSNKVLYQYVPRVVEYLMMYKKYDDQIKSLVKSRTGTGGFEIADLNKKMIDEVYNDLKLMGDSDKLKPGEYTITGSYQLAGLIAHEAFGHGVEMDTMYKGRAKSVGYFDKKVGNDIVNITDNPSYPKSYATYFFDDEGIIPQKTRILENGIFKMGLNDRFSAYKMGYKNTGNGRREDYRHKAYARMTTTYFENGNKTLDEIIKSINYGIYLDHFTLGMEDPKNWGIQITFIMGKEIKDGKFSGKVFSPVGLTGNVLDILNNVTMVADNFGYDGGHCGKGNKEIVPNSTGGPSIKTKAILV